MAIETLQDWNQRLCGCCQMPDIISPEVETEFAVGYGGKYLYPPFVDPEAVEGEYVPTLYEEVAVEKTSEAYQEGIRGWFSSGTQENIDDEPPGSPQIDTSGATWVELKIDSRTEFYTEEWTVKGYLAEVGYDKDEDPVAPWGEASIREITLEDDGPFLLPEYAETITPEEYECEAATIEKIPEQLEIKEGTAAPQPSLPPPWETASSKWADYREVQAAFTKTLASELTRDEWLDGVRQGADQAAWQEDPGIWSGYAAGAPDGAAHFVITDWPGPDPFSAYWNQTCAEKFDNNPTPTFVDAVAQKMRFRWKVPVEPPLSTAVVGTYYKITWDVVFEPKGWDDTVDDPDYDPPDEEPEGGYPPVPQVPKPGRPSRSFFQQDQTWEWSGASDRRSPWFVIPVPQEEGAYRVYNIRHTGFRSKYGTKPSHSLVVFGGGAFSEE